MRSLSSRVMFAAVLAVVVVLGGLALSRSLSLKDGGWSLVENRVWIERLPRTPRDITIKLAFIHEEGDRVGVLVHSSEFRMLLDVFLWFRRDDGRVRMTFPQDQKERMPAVRAWKCEGQAPAPFQLCMEVREGERTLRFYSREEWVIGSVDAVHAAGAPWSAAERRDAAVGEVSDVSGASF